MILVSADLGQLLEYFISFAIQLQERTDSSDVVLVLAECQLICFRFEVSQSSVLSILVFYC